MTRQDARDRDDAGRPRNARPRDGLGRPLDRAAEGEPTVGEDLRLPPAELVTLAQRLIDDGRPFHAHEVLEAAWKSGPAAERELWRGLAQLAVGLTHARRGNAKGAVALLRRGTAALAAYHGPGPHGPGPHGPGPHGPGPHGVDVAGVAQAAGALAARIERHGLAGVAEADLRLRLAAR